MNKIVVEALIHLYALLAYGNKTADKLIARSFVESYLKKNFSSKIVTEQLQVFENYYNDLIQDEKQPDFNADLLDIGKKINKQLHQKQKYFVIINLLQFIKHWLSGSSTTLSSDPSIEAIHKISDVFLIDNKEFSDLYNYIFNSIYKVVNKHKVLLVHDNPYISIKEINTLQHNGLEGDLLFYNISITNTFLFKYTGTDKLQLQGKTIFSNHIYILDKGASIRGEEIKPIYYSNITGSLLKLQNSQKVQLQVKSIKFNFPNSKNGIHKFSFLGESGKMLGIMGGSGTGKSTLLNILNGSLMPNSGSISINGYEIHENKNLLKGLIGYIPQDDLLIDELSVYQNLFYSAKLCFGNLSETEIIQRVDKTLNELDLFEIRNLKVGNPLNKFISGGQRKRLNIALELIREPSILFVDEPTSGLSSSDSERVIDLLKKQALCGKYIVINIHQPSADIFKQFDDILLLDKRGYPIYFGNPIDAISYFKEIAGMIDAEDSICKTCGNLNPEEILQTIELKEIDEYGEFLTKRKITPEEWYDHFNKKLQKTEVKNEKLDLPINSFKVPNLFNQFRIFSIRNLLAKIADSQYMVISLFVTPLLAFVLSILTKYMVGVEGNPNKYIFFDNENIPAFIFMAIIVALFVGLIVSAEEIFRDKKILKREAFLNLSQISYYNSKIFFLFVLSAIQTLLFVLIGNAVLEINGMNLSFWIVLFSASCFANMVGLNISSAFKSAVTIYIIIPLVLVPQILLSGVIVKFDKLHNSLSSQENVPLIGDVMTSRWAYEAMMVKQFKDNEYQKVFFDLEQQISEASFTMNYKIPRLIQIIGTTIKKIDDSQFSAKKTTNLELIYNELIRIKDRFGIDLIGEENKKKDFITCDENRLVKLRADLYLLKTSVSKHVAKLMDVKDSKVIGLEEANGKDYIFKLKQKYSNQRVNEFVLNNREIERVKVIRNELIQLYEPIFLFPKSKVGRAHFYAPKKNIGNFEIDTFWFNILAIWFMSLVLYIALWQNYLQRLVEFIETRKFKKSLEIN
ncbi:MAG: ATP-binding cassette domain-containing protein [Salinivirgaceae bacterium]|nr:ATP-binding cassette domain-containing protein [Salinivirgaceae bacterium]